MNKVLKYIFLSLCGTLIVFCIACSFVAGRKAYGLLRCERLQVVIKDSLANSFVSASDVRKFLDKEYGQYIGIALDSIDLVKVEKG
jgi:hypothetical protein